MDAFEAQARGLVEAFVPPAEEVGLIRPLTVLTMRKALDEVLGWRRAGLGVAVSVNLSAQLVDDRSVPGLVEEMLQELRALGVRIELDDFGRGYASARTLRDIPLDGVKIDRDLVSDLESGLDALRSLGADVVQGYHLARPMPPERIRHTLAEDAAALDARTPVTP
ncbi:EAL domain, c-di-GMP-specific phosphodiesterase class I (or its enzymatically inactive variant) [Nocardioides terrae]|uniref:EAL domain, c-di-GMP-specific phosphodiesterase class I (Or its enzymatically inactive variant) n=1 Tax=Nocardioides terrae TaxID=574651 RepID=A0A1I1L315_9ACTN|nr:EAL domain-containing protein [Nocardioides terrae]SFC64793.1 EAL domain, c-di-GMP-specific phosphodiesterase class I (or its enzymatically inactive variant) [Nocardioides terrae]